jgi:branched-chain amino acid transport system ATP-binding protein
MMLQVDDLHVAYGGIVAVRGLSFSCGAGEVVSIIGPNGAGKSSGLLAIAGGIRANIRGEIYLAGKPLASLPPEKRVAAGLAMVPERRRILATMTVRENLQVATSARRDAKAARREIGEVMSRFPILGARAQQPAGLLSGGEQQQLAIARALLAQPKVLLLDEPSLGLAPQIIDEIFDLLTQLRSDGVGIVLVEQNARRAVAIADRVFLMRQGIPTMADTYGDTALLDAYFGLTRDPSASS